MTQSIQWSFAKILATSLFLYVANLNMTAINLLLPAIKQSLGADITQTQWVMSGYMLTAGIFMIYGGRLCDKLGASKIFLSSQLLWCLSLWGCSQAPSLEWLVLARVLGGLGFALGLPASMVILMQAFPENKVHVAVSINMVVTGIAQAIGPTLAGYILTNFGWRAMFSLHLPLTLAALLLGVKYVKSSVPRESTDAGFKALLENQIFAWMNVLRAVFQLIYFALLLVLPFYLLESRGLSAVETGLLMFCLTLSFALAAPWVGMLAKRIGELLMMMLGFGMLGVALLLLCSLSNAESSGLLILVLILVGLSAAIVYSVTTAKALEVVPAEKKGLATGVFFTNALIASAVGVAFAGFILEHYTFLWVILSCALMAFGGLYCALKLWLPASFRVGEV